MDKNSSNTLIYQIELFYQHKLCICAYFGRFAGYNLSKRINFLRRNIFFGKPRPAMTPRWYRWKTWTLVALLVSKKCLTNSFQAFTSHCLIYVGLVVINLGSTWIYSRWKSNTGYSRILRGLQLPPIIMFEVSCRLHFSFLFVVVFLTRMVPWL